MKLLLTFTLLTSVVFAQEAIKEESKMEAATSKVEEKKEEKKAKKEKMGAAYKAAKDACLKENPSLKKKELKDCIISKTK